jgi:hypothetical protein
MWESCISQGHDRRDILYSDDAVPTPCWTLLLNFSPSLNCTRLLVSASKNSWNKEVQCCVFLLWGSMFGKAAFGLLQTITNIEWKPDRDAGDRCVNTRLPVTLKCRREFDGDQNKGSLVPRTVSEIPLACLWFSQPTPMWACFGIWMYWEP